MSSDQVSRFPETSISGTGELSEVRRAFSRWLSEVGFGAERIEDLSVVLSELLANAVRETPDGAEPATVGAAADEVALHLEVSNAIDPGASAPADHDWDLNDPLRTGGRGLMLVSAFVDEVQVDVADDRLVLRCTAAR